MLDMPLGPMLTHKVTSEELNDLFLNGVATKS